MYHDGINPFTGPKARKGMPLFRTVHYTITSPRLPKAFHGFTIVHLSDLHGESYGSGNQLLIRKIRQAEPDMIAMTGDMADDHPRSQANLIRLCSGLTKLWPVCYTPGNHEQGLKPAHYDRLMKKLKSLGITVLENRWCTVSRKGSFLKIYGLVMPMPYYKDPFREDYVKGICFTAAHTAEALGPADKDCYNILLSHNPLYYPACRDWGADLTLSGHIHGGIIRIPGLGGLLSPDLTLFPRYDGGHFTEQGKHLIVSRGLGNHFFVRVMNPPELVVIRLQRGKGASKQSGNVKKPSDTRYTP